MSGLILHTTEDGRCQIRLRAQQQNVWLTQLEMTDLFDATKQNISLHLKNVFEDGELDPAATVREYLTVQAEGSRKVRRSVSIYELDGVLAVGREQQEAAQADQRDQTDLQSIETTIKRRPKQ